MNGDALIIGVDTGGTFTDFAVFQNGHLTTHKELSTPEDPSQAILKGLSNMGLADKPAIVIHGSTVATNAVLEGKGCRVAYICNRGFSDILSLGRQQRPALFKLQQPSPEPPVPKELCIAIKGRVDSQGEIIEALDREELAELPLRLKAAGAEAVAINLLFSFLRPDEEQAVAEQLEADYFVSQSHEVLPEIREYERGIATWLNAYVGPLMRRYLKGLSDSLPKFRLNVMRSDGTTISADRASMQSVRLLLSGPAGGLSAAKYLGAKAGRTRLITFDMGGTSTDVALLEACIPLADKASIGPYPVAIPTVDLHTIGAGGGSIACTDSGGMLKVGPESAGAVPGPACYGRGGTSPTVTDAHVVLGRIPSKVRLGGDLGIDLKAATAALEDLAKELNCGLVDAALGVIGLANEHMARALRLISVERGHEPAEYSLMSFGGAGGLHVCDLAEALGMKHAIIPAFGGVLSALGMLVSQPGRVYTQTVLKTLDTLSADHIDALFNPLEAQAKRELQKEGLGEDELDTRYELLLRYRGQSGRSAFGLAAPEVLIQRFRERHEAEYGYLLDLPIELAEIRIHLRGIAAIEELGADQSTAGRPGQVYMAELGRDIPFWFRGNLPMNQEIPGPVIIGEPNATSYIKPGWRLWKDSMGHLILRYDG